MGHMGRTTSRPCNTPFWFKVRNSFEFKIGRNSNNFSESFSFGAWAFGQQAHEEALRAKGGCLRAIKGGQPWGPRPIKGPAKGALRGGGQNPKGPPTPTSSPLQPPPLSHLLCRPLPPPLPGCSRPKVLLLPAHKPHPRCAALRCISTCCRSREGRRRT